MLTGKNLNLGILEHRIKQYLTCRSCYVVYVIFFLCKRFYIGKTNRAMFTRFREHKNSVVTGKGAPRLIEHIHQVHKGNTSILTFAGLEQVPAPLYGAIKY
ncbi:hypothetical protein GDO81_012015 [Engystomops pustulosus]|uniref:GIY-YIG domain-containing protein n=1 Tax=Engystomops pustulosus TaxID=76066 RepID=A0AAV7BIN1_ENGPU|nr:hypothetical protein GDO81_012015 [Engystomops pustulosus]